MTHTNIHEVWYYYDNGIIIVCKYTVFNVFITYVCTYVFITIENDLKNQTTNNNG